jgi:hypothetical protein
MQAILSTAYLPNIQYCSKLVKHDNIVIEQHENFLKQTYRNRCEIATCNGKLALSIPVIAARTHTTRIREVLIDNTETWQRKHIQAITSAYKNAPFFDYYSDEIFSILNTPETHLFTLNYKLITRLKALIGIERKILLSESFTLPGNVNDFRYSIHPKKQMQKADSHYIENRYYQVFENKHGFLPNLSIIDVIFNEGPLTYSILKASIK